MTTPERYNRIAFVASAGVEAQQALAQLTGLYGNLNPADADVVVALGGDGLMLQTLHQHMHSGKPIYGMHRGTVGFLMNEFSSHDLHARLRQHYLSPEKIRSSRTIAASATDLFGAHACVLDYLRPARDIGFDERRKRLGRPACRIEPKRTHPFLNIRQFQ